MEMVWSTARIIARMTAKKHFPEVLLKMAALNTVTWMVRLIIGINVLIHRVGLRRIKMDVRYNGYS